MNKPRSKSEEKRSLILAAAEQLFTEKGFQSTSMDMVAKEAGVSKQTVYSHFGNKDELFVAAINKKCIAYDLATVGVVDLDPAQLRASLITLAQRFSALILSNEAVNVYRTCVSQAESYPHVARMFHTAGPKQVIAEVAKMMAAYQQMGVLKIADSHTAAVQFLLMMQGEQRMRVELNIEERLSEEAHQKYIHDSVDMFIRAYS
ncbi:TetR/AcrR family transcriptional regulator [Amphritea balenae]|uniref:TetR/AcrR family transcriptional regulator n=1 Tax=Amphritea balenae TaxID=452629 RepID=A0A3P1SWL4_9GAMM|nr:TetR/AcrR family transcriptional regulator [Amphritea balenae]RRD01365.1 TetR/AcrR family transcriptional regulator [Amphritea balenae]GGK57698.1 TetR family transcriptional regulator [Amphritea balenae]